MDLVVVEQLEGSHLVPQEISIMKNNLKDGGEPASPFRQSPAHTTFSAILVGAALQFLPGVQAWAQSQDATRLFPPRIEGKSVNLDWNSGGQLQSAPSPTGPWHNVDSPAKTKSSISTPLAGGTRFFRVVENGVPGEVIPLLADAPFAPFPVSDASVQLSRQTPGDANAVIRVKFQEKVRPTSVPLLVDDQLLLLNDTGEFPDEKRGDQVFTGRMRVEVAELEELNKSIESLPARSRITHEFDGRSLVKTLDLQPFKLSSLLEGAIVPFHMKGCTWGSPLAFDWRKTLMITNLSVVEDPSRTWDPCPNYPVGTGTKMGAWTFGRLMTDIANQAASGVNPSDFVRQWLRGWEFDQTINSDLVPNRDAAIKARIINAWQAASGGPGKALDLSIAPFRLLAIVNRVDLRGNPAYGGGSLENPCDPPCVGGESRFVFCAVDPSNCSDPRLIVILEYCNPARTCREIKAWGSKWAALNALPFGPVYNNALEAITDQFAGPGLNPSQHPNHSLLNQLRSNDILSGPWELREWKLAGSGSEAGHLHEVTVNQTLNIIHNNQPIVNTYIGANLGALLSDSHTIPLLFAPAAGAQGVPFLGGSAPIPNPLFFWNGNPSLNTAATSPGRHKLSLATCNGCHGGETGTFFTHVDCRPKGQPAPLSRFLTGLAALPDPAGAPITRSFADLDRRVQDLHCLVTTPCFFHIGFLPLKLASPH